MIASSLLLLERAITHLPPSVNTTWTDFPRDEFFIWEHLHGLPKPAPIVTRKKVYPVKPSDLPPSGNYPTALYFDAPKAILDPSGEDDREVPVFTNPRWMDMQAYILMTFVGIATFLILACCLRCQCYKFFTMSDEFAEITQAHKRMKDSRKGGKKVEDETAGEKGSESLRKLTGGDVEETVRQEEHGEDTER